MKISAVDTRPTQLRLFDEPLGNHGHRRTVIGDLFEELTARLFDGRRHKTMNGYYCPDVSAGDCYLEVKAMGRSNQTFIYEGRLRKDFEFIEAGHRLFYVVWSHTCATLNLKTVGELRADLLMTIEWVALLPFDYLGNLCLWMKPDRLNSGYRSGGYGLSGPTSEKVYGSGYRIPRRIIEPWKFAEWQIDIENQQTAPAPVADIHERKATGG